MKTVKFLLMALVATAFVGCNDSDDSTSKIQLDTPAPAVDESTITTTSATVTWSAISNAASYEVQLDGATVQTVTSPSVSLSSLTAGTSYTVGVRAIPGDTEAYRLRRSAPARSRPRTRAVKAAAKAHRRSRAATTT